MLEYVGIPPSGDYIDRYPRQLSGGEKQRVALIRSMLINPDLILADEAVSALDVSLQVGMMGMMIACRIRLTPRFWRCLTTSRTPGT